MLCGRMAGSGKSGGGLPNRTPCRKSHPGGTTVLQAPGRPADRPDWDHGPRGLLRRRTALGRTALLPLEHSLAFHCNDQGQVCCIPIGFVATIFLHPPAETMLLRNGHVVGSVNAT
ncbi:hypothetical protein GCM10023335_68020 [Streptomyces siamensis]|uniref:Uncharacterized protein n=1 Tax=Streptomyces siamensis TaxID=1274986 RepID=A0ABP9JE65_9ACTN